MCLTLSGHSDAMLNLKRVLWFFKTPFLFVPNFSFLFFHFYFIPLLFSFSVIPSQSTFSLPEKYNCIQFPLSKPTNFLTCSISANGTLGRFRNWVSEVECRLVAIPLWRLEVESEKARQSGIYIFQLSCIACFFKEIFRLVWKRWEWIKYIGYMYMISMVLYLLEARCIYHIFCIICVNNRFIIVSFRWLASYTKYWKRNLQI